MKRDLIVEYLEKVHLINQMNIYNKPCPPCGHMNMHRPGREAHICKYTD